MIYVDEPREVSVIHRIALACQRGARLLGDRQNSDSTLKARDAEFLVSTLLDAGNTLDRLVQDHRQRQETENDDAGSGNDPAAGPGG